MVYSIYMDIYIKKFKQYQKSAESRSLDFGIDLADFETLVKSPCKYCGHCPESENKLNGIDRIDNKLGYIIDNIVSCCPTCNWAKQTTEVKHFIDWVHKVSAYQNNYKIKPILDNKFEQIDFHKQVSEFAKNLIISRASIFTNKSQLAKSLSLTPRQLRYQLKALGLF